MPLPINSFPSEQPALLPCEPLAGQGGATIGGPAIVASFSSLLNQAGEPAANTAAPARAGSSPARPAYPGLPYIPAIAAADVSIPVIVDTVAAEALPEQLPVIREEGDDTDATEAGEDSAVADEKEPVAKTEVPATTVLSYQLVAGQWLPQQPAAPVSPPPVKAEVSAAEVKVADVKVADVKVAEAKVAEVKRADVNVADVKVPEAKTTEVKVADVKVAEAKATEAKAIKVKAAPVAEGESNPVSVAAPAMASQAREVVSTLERQPAPPREATPTRGRPANDVSVPVSTSPLSPRVAGGNAEASPISPSLVRPPLETSARVQPAAAPLGVAVAVGTKDSAAASAPVVIAAPDTQVATTARAVRTPGPASGSPQPRATGRIVQSRTDFGPAEKFAGPDDLNTTDSVLGVKTPEAVREKTTVVTDVKQLTGTPLTVGTPAANREDAMSYSAASKTPDAHFVATADLAQAAGISGVERGALPLQASAPVSVQAAQIVREIHAIGERVSAVERNSVEVQFDFNDTERLSVRVEYRDGTVHTTFRTDSPELRETIASEWQAHAAVVEHRSYRVAEPIFNSAGSDQPQLSSSFAGDSSGRQRSAEQRPEAGAFSSNANGRGGDSTTPATRTLSPLNRPETSLHLHTFA